MIHDEYVTLFAGYPSNSKARAVVTATGASVGYISAYLEEKSSTYLLQQQKTLEKEVLHKSDEDLKTELAPYYLRQLIRIRQASACCLPS
jgi:hypothetical protein